MKKYLFLILTSAALIAGCLSDTIDKPQVVAQLILQPPAVYYKCITTYGMATDSLQVLWNPSTVDIQQNFKGYFVELFNSAPYYIPSTDGTDSTLGSPIDFQQVPKIDTSCIFTGKVIQGSLDIKQGNRYTVKVWGERFPNPAKPDSMVLSQFPTRLSFNFDSRPVLAPDSIFASSASSSSVNLFWLPSKSEINIGMAGYIVRYIDPANSSAHVIYFSRFPKDTSKSQLIQGRYEYASTPINVPANLAPPFEREYVFWVKAVRQDSTESDDSIGIHWSGAEQLSTVATLDTGIFIGIANFSYTMQQTDPNGVNSLLQITQPSGPTGNFVIMSYMNQTLFVNQVVSDTGLTLSRNFLKAPFAVSDFTQTQISFPASSASNTSTIIYALFPGGSRARLLFTVTQDTVSHLSTNQIQASFQPQETPQLPFF